jgi:hypothetical protein
MTELKESSPVDAVLSLVVDPSGRDALLTLHFESDIAVRLPMTSAVAMRIWAYLDKARTDHGWSVPTTPVLTDKLQ